MNKRMNGHGDRGRGLDEGKHTGFTYIVPFKRFNIQLHVEISVSQISNDGFAIPLEIFTTLT